jgi:voltage-gated potassium channel
MLGSRRFMYVATGLVTFNVLLGACGYMIIEKASFLDALYMTVITVTTVGFGEVFPLSSAGKAFTIFIVVFGTGTLAYTATQVLDSVVAGELGRIFGKKRMTMEINRLGGHYIICGVGRMGKVICENLHNSGVPFVVVDYKETLRENMNKLGYLFISGDATKEETLAEAGIMKAKGLVTVVDSDVKNVYIVITAKGMRKDLYVVAKAAEEEAHSKLTWAGADKVVSPYTIGGMSIAHSITKPSVTEFIDVALGHGDYNVNVEEVRIEKDSFFDGKQIKESNIRKAGIIIIAIKKAHGAFMYNPGPDAVISGGDTLIALGRKADFEALGKMKHNLQG